MPELEPPYPPLEPTEKQDPGEEENSALEQNSLNSSTNLEREKEFPKKENPIYPKPDSSSEKPWPEPKPTVLFSAEPERRESIENQEIKRIIEIIEKALEELKKRIAEIESLLHRLETLYKTDETVRGNQAWPNSEKDIYKDPEKNITKDIGKKDLKNEPFANSLEELNAKTQPPEGFNHSLPQKPEIPEPFK